jgi:hypothetical protein
MKIRKNNKNTHYSLNKNSLRDGDVEPDEGRLVCSFPQRIHFMGKSVIGNYSLCLLK